MVVIAGNTWDPCSNSTSYIVKIMFNNSGRCWMEKDRRCYGTGRLKVEMISGHTTSSDYRAIPKTAIEMQGALDEFRVIGIMIKSVSNARQRQVKESYRGVRR